MYRVPLDGKIDPGVEGQRGCEPAPRKEALDEPSTGIIQDHYPADHCPRRLADAPGRRAGSRRPGTVDRTGTGVRHADPLHHVEALDRAPAI